MTYNSEDYFINIKTIMKYIFIKSTFVFVIFYRVIINQKFLKMVKEIFNILEEGTSFISCGGIARTRRACIISVIKLCDSHDRSAIREV